MAVDVADERLGARVMRPRNPPPPPPDPEHTVAPLTASGGGRASARQFECAPLTAMSFISVSMLCDGRDCAWDLSRYRCPAGLRFSDQLRCGSCSGTLIAPDLIATAGHCIDSGSCGGVTAVFHATDQTMTAHNTVPTNTVYRCASVVTSVLSDGKDYAVFRLDRAVPASVATPVTVGSDSMPVGTGLMMIGHPSGNPPPFLFPPVFLPLGWGGREGVRIRLDPACTHRL